MLVLADMQEMFENVWQWRVQYLGNAPSNTISASSFEGQWRLCGQASQFQREGNLFKFFQWKLEGTSMHLLRVFYSIAKQNIAYMSEFWFPIQIFRFLKLHYMRWVMGENVCLVGVQHNLGGASNFMCWRRMKGNLTKNEEVFNNTYSRGKIRAKSWEFGSLWPTPVIMNPGLGPNKPSLYTLTPLFICSLPRVLFLAEVTV